MTGISSSEARERATSTFRNHVLEAIEVFSEAAALILENSSAVRDDVAAIRERLSPPVMLTATDPNDTLPPPGQLRAEPRPPVAPFSMIGNVIKIPARSTTPGRGPWLDFSAEPVENSRDAVKLTISSANTAVVSLEALRSVVAELERRANLRATGT